MQIAAVRDGMETDPVRVVQLAIERGTVNVRSRFRISRRRNCEDRSCIRLVKMDDNFRKDWADEFVGKAGWIHSVDTHHAHHRP